MAGKDMKRDEAKEKIMQMEETEHATKNPAKLVKEEKKEHMKKSEITNEELLKKAEEMIDNDLKALPSDEELLAEIDKMIGVDPLAKAEDHNSDGGRKKAPGSSGEKENGDDSKEDGGGYDKGEGDETPDKDFPGKKVKDAGGEGAGGTSTGGDDSKETGGGYKSNDKAPPEDFPGKTVAAPGGSGGRYASTGGDDSKEKGGGYKENSWNPKEEFPGMVVMKSLDKKFDILIDCFKGMNEKLDVLAGNKEVKKSEKDEVADDIIEKASKSTSDDLVKSFKAQLDEISKSLSTVRQENEELRKSLTKPAAKRQSLTGYSVIEKSAPKENDVNSMTKAQKLTKLEKMFKSGRKELGQDIIKLNSAGVLSERARQALEE